MPVLSAGLVGCLLHPGGRAAPRDGGADGNPTDGMHADGSSMSICAGAGAPVDPLASSPCGSGSSIGSDYSGNYNLESQGGTLTAGVTMGNLSCAWNIDDGPAFQGDGSSGLMANAYWGTQPVGAPISVPFCARIRIVQGSGSGGQFVVGQVDDGSGWQTVASGNWFASGAGQVSIGVSGMCSTATFDHFDYVAPDAP